MLRELHISRLAVIEDAAIEFTPGLNAFTGGTGAGKSLVIGAFEALLGLRRANDMIRPGADEARISGLFELHDPEAARQIGELLDQQLEPGEELLIIRKLFASGRSSVSVNGQVATAAMVRSVGELLVDIHGQHDHQFLLRPSNQLQILDAFGKCTPLRQRFSELYARLRELREHKAQLEASRTLRRQQLELYEFQADEIDAGEPSQGEFPELEARAHVLENVQTIKGRAGQAYAALYDADGSIGERLQMVVHVLQDLTQLDEQLNDITEGIRSATLTLQELAYELHRYADRLEDDPAELAQVNDRLNTLNRLIAKYADRSPGEDPLQGVIDYRAQIGGEIDRLRSEDENLTGLDAGIAKLDAQLAAVGADLTAARRAAAEQLHPLIEAQLRELGMSDAKFRIQIETQQEFSTGAAASAAVPSEPDDPVPLDPSTPLDSPTGLDRIEFIAQTNPGQAFRPLRQIASGGELSRVMLALKSILAGTDRVSVLVFDEIDANIGGRLGSVIGEKLRALAHAPTATPTPTKSSRAKAKAADHTSAPRHQVLCITHLPQIAAYADRHFRIHKSVVGKGKHKETVTSVTPIQGDARIDELAEMMAGHAVTPTTRKQAQELLAAAD